MSAPADMWRTARQAWPADVSRDPDLREPQLSEQLTIAHTFTAQRLQRSEAATVGLSALKCVAEAIAGRWVSSTAVLAALLAAGYRTRVGRRGEVTVYARPRDLWLIRALRRGRIPPHHDLAGAPR